MSILRENVEAPVPYRLDHALPGLPVTTCGADQTDEFVLVTAGRRGLRWSVEELRISGTQVLNCGSEDHLACLALVHAGQELLIITRDGYGRRLLAGWIPFPDKPNRKGKSLVARRSQIAALATDGDWAITDEQLLTIDGSGIPLVESTKTFPLIELLADDQLRYTLAKPLN
jgi:hypothetical protein